MAGGGDVAVMLGKFAPHIMVAPGEKDGDPALSQLTGQAIDVFDVRLFIAVVGDVAVQDQEVIAAVNGGGFYGKLHTVMGVGHVIDADGAAGGQGGEGKTEKLPAADGGKGNASGENFLQKDTVFSGGI